MKKLLVTVFVCLSVSNTVSYAQEQTTIVTEKESITTNKANTEQESAIESEPVVVSEVVETDDNKNIDQHPNQVILHILVQSDDFYRIDKGQKGIFFIIQDFYNSGEKRTDPYLITNIEEAKHQNFDAVNYDHMDVNGLLIVWFKNGQVEQKGVFDQGQRKGLWVSWYENGQKKSSGHYKEGLKEGQWTVWYQNGRRMQKGYYKADRREGVWIYWYGNGRKKEAGRYRQDERVERWSHWDDAGKLVKDVIEETVE